MPLEVFGIEVSNSDHGWQKVSYAKKQKKNQQKPSTDSSRIAATNGSGASGADNVFRSLEKQSEERRRKIEAQFAAMNADDDAPVRSAARNRSDDEDSDLEGGALQNGAADEKKKEKQKKPKKPKVTVAEAAAKIDADDLSVFLADVSVSSLFTD